MADEETTTSGAISKWLATLGYPAASLETPMQPHIARWWGYLEREADFFHRTERLQDGSSVDVRLRSCSPAAMVVDDLAALIYNERAQISVPDDAEADAWLAKWLESVAWADRAPLAIGRMCGTGTAAWALHIRGLQAFGRSSQLQVEPARYDARSIVPLSWEADRCTDCAFIASAYVKGARLTQVEVHRPQDCGDYELMCAFFDDTGERVEPAGFLDADKAVSTKQQNPTFSLIRPADDNRYWDYSPMGVAVFNGKEDVLETVDLAFNALGDEIVLGRKMLALPEAMMGRDTAGNLVLPWEEGQRFFLAAKGTTYDDKLGVYEYNPAIRSEEDRQMLETALQMLGKRMGFGMKYYALDAAGGITTAKQVASDNAELMRTVRRHEHVIAPAIASLMAAAAGIYRSLSTERVPDITGAVEVVLGDSIIQDEDSLRERDRADVAAGLLEPWRYMVRWQGYSEEDARAFTGEGDVGASVPAEA